MSYVPEDQLLAGPLRAAADALVNVCERIRNRLDDQGEWKAEHLEEIAELLREVTALESKLRLLAGQVR